MARKVATPSLMVRSREIGPEQKAIYHNTTGAGPNRVVREFLGLTEAEEAGLVAQAEALIARHMNDQFGR